MTESTTALLVIDVQKSFVHMPYWSELGLSEYQLKQAELISIARKRGWHVIHIYHLEDRAPFNEACGLVVPMGFIDRQANDPVFFKHVHNALTESGLQPWLEKYQITNLVVSGIRTEQCCETTTRVASDLGYQVDFVTEATLSFAMQHPESRKLYDLQALREHTELVLADRFAKIRRVADYK